MDTPKIATTLWDAADYIETPEDVVEFLKAALEENDAKLLTEAIAAVSRAKGMAVLAQRADVPLDDLFQSSANGGSELSALLGIMEAMGLRLDVRAKQADPEPA